VECLEGSELEDELVAQQMQQALELGQLDRISEMLSSMGLDEDEDDDDPYSEMFGDDTV
jgi:ribosome assembly protein YihI (activator of Der GTPase)